MHQYSERHLLFLVEPLLGLLRGTILSAVGRRLIEQALLSQIALELHWDPLLQFHVVV